MMNKTIAVEQEDIFGVSLAEWAKAQDYCRVLTNISAAFQLGMITREDAFTMMQSKKGLIK